MSVVAVFAAVVAPPLIFAVLALILGQRSVRRAGISAERPACAKCLYPLGGWSSPRCPECGADVREHGVRVGPMGRRAALTFATVWLTLLFIIPATIVVIAPVFAETRGILHAHVVSIEGQQFHATFTSSFAWRRFPPKHDHTTFLTLMRLKQHASGGWTNGRWRGSAPDAEETLTFQSEFMPNDLQAMLLRAVADVKGLDEPGPLEQNQATELSKAFDAMLAAHSDRNFIRVSPFAMGSQFASRGYGRSGGAGTWWGATVIAIISGVIPMVLALRLIHRRYRPGWRQAIPNEWLTRQP